MNEHKAYAASKARPTHKRIPYPHSKKAALPLPRTWVEVGAVAAQVAHEIAHARAHRWVAVRQQPPQRGEQPCRGDGLVCGAALSIDARELCVWGGGGGEGRCAHMCMAVPTSQGC